MSCREQWTCARLNKPRRSILKSMMMGSTVPSRCLPSPSPARQPILRISSSPMPPDTGAARRNWSWDGRRDGGGREEEGGVGRREEKGTETKRSWPFWRWQCSSASHHLHFSTSARWCLTHQKTSIIFILSSMLEFPQIQLIWKTHEQFALLKWTVDYLSLQF